MKASFCGSLFATPAACGHEGGTGVDEAKAAALLHEPEAGAIVARVAKDGQATALDV